MHPNQNNPMTPEVLEDIRRVKINEAKAMLDHLRIRQKYKDCERVIFYMINGDELVVYMTPKNSLMETDEFISIKDDENSCFDYTNSAGGEVRQPKVVTITKSYVISRIVVDTQASMGVNFEKSIANWEGILEDLENSTNISPEQLAGLNLTKKFGEA